MKKFSASFITTAAVAVITIVAFVLYLINVSSAGYYQGATVSGVVAFSIVGIVLALVVVASNFLNLDGFVGTLVGLVVKACKIVLPLMLMLAGVGILGARIEGLGYIYFSNADVAKEVGTAANLASAGLAVTSIIFYIVDAIVAIVAAFFSAEKKAVAE